MTALEKSDDTRWYANNITVEQINEVIEWSNIVARSSPDEYKLLAKKVKDAAFRRDTYQKLKECETYCFDKNIEDIEQKVYKTIDAVMTEYNTNTDLRE